MRIRAYCAHPSIRDHWVLNCMRRGPDQVVSLNLFRTLDSIRYTSLHRLKYTLPSFSVVGLDSFLNTAGGPPLTFPLTPGKSAFVSNPISNDLPKNDPFKVQRRTNNRSPYSFLNAPAPDVRPHIWTRCPSQHHYFLKLFSRHPPRRQSPQSDSPVNCHTGCHARGNWTVAEWNPVVFSDESKFNLSSDYNHVRVWRPRGERLNPAFALQRHTAPIVGVMVWGVIAYNTRPTLV
ncbi:transposable element Tcb1 transposase [Trichonephila clavipes]|nr:transposable element Tcb1 transposase [Trichonephila clavipes]